MMRFSVCLFFVVFAIIDFHGGPMSASEVTTVQSVLDQCGTDAKYWGLRTCGEGGVVELHPPIAVGSKEWPLIQSGRYFLLLFDAQRKQLGGGRLVDWTLPTNGPSPPDDKKSLDSESADASLGMDLDSIGRRELEQRKLFENQRGTLDYYNKLMQTLGIRGQQEVEDKAAQATLYANLSRRVIEEYIDLHDKVADRLKRAIVPPPPPEPPPWDRIIGAAAPALAVIYTETVRAIKGMPSDASRQNDKLLLPGDGAHTKIHEVLGRVGTEEKLNEVLTDKRKLADWMTELMEVMGATPGKKEAAQAESERGK